MLGGGSCGGTQGLEVAGLVGDAVVGGKCQHDGVGLLFLYGESDEAEGGCGVTALRLQDEVLGRQFRQVLAHQGSVLGPGTDQDVRSGEPGPDPPVCILKQGTGAVEVEELLGEPGLTAGPEALAGTPGEQHGLDSFHGRCPPVAR